MVVGESATAEEEMKIEPVIVRTSDLSWESWPPEQITERGRVSWKTLLSAGKTPTEHLTMGFAEVPAGEQLKVHQHAQPEAYYVVEGEGTVHLEGQEQIVRAGTAIFIP